MRAEEELGALAKLRAFSSAVPSITQKGKGWFHLIALNSRDKSVTIQAYPRTDLERATDDYARIEARAAAGEPIEAVLVSAGPIAQLHRAYPNYFLDTNDFVDRVESIIRGARSTGNRGPNDSA
jgi:hypothetical protein